MTLPREGLTAVVRDRRATITGVRPFTAEDGHIYHLVEVEYTDDVTAELDLLLWDVEPGADVLGPSPPRIRDRSPLAAPRPERGLSREAIGATRRGRARSSSELGEQVRKAVEVLLGGRRQVLAPTWVPAAASAVYSAACHCVMRLVVILFAEARELFPVDNPIYHRAYGLRGLLARLDRQSADRRPRGSAWHQLLALFRLLHRGSPHPELRVPAYGGELFKPGDPDGDDVQRALARLESLEHPPDDHTLLTILELLTSAGPQRAPIDFTELTSEYIGILYEGLLDYRLRRADGQPIVFLGIGDQPAIPLDRLEGMSDRAIAALVDRARVTREDDDEDGDETADTAALIDTDDPELPDDDEYARAHARAVDWARRAAVAGKLVQRPAGRNADVGPRYIEERDRVARRLVAGLKLPGELYLARWGGTRKGAGSFYTRPQLTHPTVRRTLGPLTHDDDGRVRPPEVLLDLTICDPAMGSGSFLVAALRVLADLVVQSLRLHGRIIADGGRIRVDCDRLPEADRLLAAVGFDERLTATVRRAVVERCLYGVDIDPLAAELARVALWIETLDRALPLTFLDHKLRCGDALVGAWIDRCRDYPLLAWWRQSPDENWRGVTHAGDTWAHVLKDRRKLVIAEQARLLTARPQNVCEGDELDASLARVRELYRRLRDVPAARPDRRAELWQRQIEPDLARVREACDLWCALWFWPLDRLGDAPTPATLRAPSAAARAIARDLRNSLRFFHWELEFPDVFNARGAGFDAIVGNPPWDTRKPSSKEFFSELDPLYRAYGKQEALARQRELFARDPAIERRWLDHVGGLKDAGNFVRHAAAPFGDREDGQGGPQLLLVPRRVDASRRLHREWAAQRARRIGYADPEHPFVHQGSADLNSYKLFVEQAYVLLGTGGQLGLITPSGLYTDKGSVDLRRLLLDRCKWRWLYGFENRKKLFDIDGRFKFAVSIAEKGEKTTAVRAAFMRHDLEDWAATDPPGALTYPAERIHAFSPSSLSVLEIRSERDLEVLSTIYASSVLLGDRGPDGWDLTYAREFDTTNDSAMFIPRDEAAAAGYGPDEYGRWTGPGGDVLLPLYEGRMIGQFDFSKKGWVRGKGRAAVWREIPWDDKVLEPQFLIRRSDAWKPGARTHRGPKIAYMRIGSATNARTVISTYLRDTPAGDSVFYFVPGSAPVSTALSVVGMFGTFTYDFAVRARAGGLNLSEFLMLETPLVGRAAFQASGLVPQILALACGGAWFAPEWLEVGRSAARCELSGIGERERLRLRCILDAAVAALYGLSRDDLRWILRDCDYPRERLSDQTFSRALDPKGFWRVDRDRDPELRHTVLTLIAFDALERLLAEHRGDRIAAIRALSGLDGDAGWTLPETLCLAEHGLGHDARARTPQPVAGRLGPRHLAGQPTRTPAESWAECERHARAIRDDSRHDS